MGLTISPHSHIPVTNIPEYPPGPISLASSFKLDVMSRGVARIFQRGGHTGSNNIVMAFSPRNIVGCLLKKGLTKGGSRAPQDPPSYAPDVIPWNQINIVLTLISLLELNQLPGVSFIH